MIELRLPRALIEDACGLSAAGVPVVGTRPVAPDRAQRSRRRRGNWIVAGWHLEQGGRGEERRAARRAARAPRAWGRGRQLDPAIIQRQLAGRRNSPLRSRSFAAPVRLTRREGPLCSGRFNMAAQGWIGGAGSGAERRVCLRSGRPRRQQPGSAFATGGSTRRSVDQAITPVRAPARASTSSSMQRIVYDRLPVIPLDYTFIFSTPRGPRVTGFARNMLAFPVDAETWDTQ